MKSLRFDSIGGASGDMILSALIDLGASLKELDKQLASMKIDKFTITAKKHSDHGLCGTQASVKIHDHEHPHRGLKDISKLINNSRIAKRAKELSIAVFETLAKAEAKVHGTTIDKIHFHEVGAMDSIIDIVGSCIAIDLLEVDIVTCGPLPAGYGTISSAHGVLPNPAPATAELLRNHEIVQVNEPFELVTPTGAALLTTWQKLMPAKGVSNAKLLKTGNGFGQRKLATRANMLRAILLETASISTADICVVLECNLDDTTPEIIGALMQKLMTSGALDAFTIPVQMKKQRPGTLLTVLCKQEDREKMIELIFTESTTFGIREHTVTRTILERKLVTVKTKYGPVRVKLGYWKNRPITASPEYEDCRVLAEKNKIPVRKVYDEASRKAEPLQ